jgi:hypothetical protein
VGELIETASEYKMDVIVFSEYVMSKSEGAIEINRFLRKEGFISVREVDGREYVEIGDCKAFAICDHQIAFIMCKRIDNLAEVIKNSFPEVDMMINCLGYDIVLVAPANKWFCYYWWFNEKKAPLFSRNVDIHRKPGYDPLELFIDKEGKVPLKPELIKGSHGRLSEHEKQMPVLIFKKPEYKECIKERPCSVVNIPEIVQQIACRKS